MAEVLVPGVPRVLSAEDVERKMECREMVQLSRSLWKMAPSRRGEPSLSPRSEELEEEEQDTERGEQETRCGTFDDAEDLRAQGWDLDNLEECSLRTVVFHTYTDIFFLESKYKTAQGEDVSLAWSSWDTCHLTNCKSEVASVDLGEHEVLVGITGRWHSCSPCSCAETPSLLTFTVLNIRTGRRHTVSSPDNVGREDDRAFLLQAPPGFCIAGFHGSQGAIRPHDLGFYFQRIALGWNPSDVHSFEHMFPTLFLRDLQSYSDAKKDPDCWLHVLSAELEDIILGKLLEMHTVQCKPLLVREYANEQEYFDDDEEVEEWLDGWILEAGYKDEQVGNMGITREARQYETEKRRERAWRREGRRRERKKEQQRRLLHEGRRCARAKESLKRAERKSSCPGKAHWLSELTS